MQSEAKRPTDDHSTSASSTSERRSATATSGTTPLERSETSTDKTTHTSGGPEDADVAGSQDLFGKEPGKHAL